jgi:hypothetical protein
MLRDIRIQNSMSKGVVPNEPCNPRVKVMGDLKGKVEKFKLSELDLIDLVFFPQLNIDVFWSITPDDLKGIQFMPKPEFINQFNSTIMNLKDLLVFDTTGDVAQCNKFLINRVHDKSLSLYRKYPIHAEDIHQLIELSLEVEDVSKRFQGHSKNNKKKEEPKIYERFHTQRGGRITKIDPILLETIITSCYIIYNKVTKSYYKEECRLDALSITYFCTNGIVFNWCSYLLEEILVVCEEAQGKGGTFTYRYLLMAFKMIKWKPPIARLLPLEDKGHLVKMFEPWHSRTDSEYINFNTMVFSKLYNGIIDRTQRLRIPHEILN